MTCETDGDAIAAHVARAGTSTVQLVDAPARGACAAVRRAHPRVEIVQVIHVRGPDSLDDARAAAEHADALLLDSGDPTLAVKQLGGTGRTHDWSLSRRIVDSVARPVFLAGGLHAGNVARAIAEVRPFGVDVCSGVRDGGRLDAPRLRAFFAAARAPRE